jgi:hypothetical protein
LEHALFT